MSEKEADVIELRPLPLFPLGRVVGTPAVLEHFGRQQSKLGLYLARHATGDWGEIDSEDRATNNAAVREGSRVLSQYRFKDRKFWIITEADRSTTTFLFPSEY